MTPKDRVRKFWPEAWSKYNSERKRWEIFRHSAWGIHMIGFANNPKQAWHNAAEQYYLQTS